MALSQARARTKRASTAHRGTRIRIPQLLELLLGLHAAHSEALNAGQARKQRQSDKDARLLSNIGFTAADDEAKASDAAPPEEK